MPNPLSAFNTLVWVNRQLKNGVMIKSIETRGAIDAGNMFHCPFATSLSNVLISSTDNHGLVATKSTADTFVVGTRITSRTAL